MAEELDVIANPEEDESGPDPAEQEALVRQIGEDVSEAFVAYLRGEASFEDVTFLLHDALQDVFFIAQGSYDLIDDADEDEWEDDEYDLDEATAEQEDLAQEPARG